MLLSPLSPSSVNSNRHQTFLVAFLIAMPSLMAGARRQNTDAVIVNAAVNMRAVRCVVEVVTGRCIGAM